MVSSTLGSGTSTGWKRRASAASFSMLLRYSSSVVAPITRSSPRASAGLSMLRASIPPSLPAPPAPTRVWISSRKMISSSPVRPDLVDHLLQPFLEVAPVAGAGDQAGQVELDDPLAEQGLRHVAVADPLGQPFDDGGLADAGLADQHRVVLGTPGQDLHGLLDLVGPADHRVDLVVAGQVGEVLPVLVQGGGAAVRLRPGHRPALGVGGLQRLGLDPAGGQHPPGRRLRVERQRHQDVLGTDVVGAHRPGQLVGVEQRPLGGRGQRQVAAAPPRAARRRPFRRGR